MLGPLKDKEEMRYFQKDVGVRWAHYIHTVHFLSLETSFDEAFPGICFLSPTEPPEIWGVPSFGVFEKEFP